LGIETNKTKFISHGSKKRFNFNGNIDLNEFILVEKQFKKPNNIAHLYLVFFHSRFFNAVLRKSVQDWE
jgi:hypothetical protein